jgi:thioredoxin 1
MASPHVLEFTDDNFQEEVLQSDLPVLVDFWAEWCGPCRAVAPIVEEIAKEYSGRLKVGKVNTDYNQQQAAALSITSIPQLFLFKGGKVVEQMIGAQPKARILQKLTPHL